MLRRTLRFVVSGGSFTLALLVLMQLSMSNSADSDFWLQLGLGVALTACTMLVVGEVTVSSGLADRWTLDPKVSDKLLNRLCLVLLMLAGSGWAAANWWQNINPRLTVPLDAHPSLTLPSIHAWPLWLVAALPAFGTAAATVGLIYKPLDDTLRDEEQSRKEAHHAELDKLKAGGKGGAFWYDALLRNKKDHEKALAQVDKQAQQERATAAAFKAEANSKIAQLQAALQATTTRAEVAEAAVEERDARYDLLSQEKHEVEDALRNERRSRRAEQEARTTVAADLAGGLSREIERVLEMNRQPTTASPTLAAPNTSAAPVAALLPSRAEQVVAVWHLLPAADGSRRALHLLQSGDRLHWRKQQGSAAPVEQNETNQAVLTVLYRAQGQILSQSSVAAQVGGLEAATVSKALQRLAGENYVQKAAAGYYLRPPDKQGQS